MIQKTAYDIGGLDVPDLIAIPDAYRSSITDLFNTWSAVRGRNATLTMYYRMKNRMKDLGISIPPQLTGVNSVVGWADKAVRVMSVRSQFDGFVSDGGTISELDRQARINELPILYDDVCRAALVHGVACMTVMRKGDGSEDSVVRGFSANQCAMLWDKDANGIGCGIVLADVSVDGQATRYVAHFPDAVLTISRPYIGPDTLGEWSCEVEDNPQGVPLMVPFVFDPDFDRPLGHSRITPEVQGIIDKAMRDVLRMEVGAEFFTAPQRYILGADPSLFAVDDDSSGTTTNDGSDDDDDAATTLRIDQNKLMKAYLGQILAITRDPNGDVPQVGQFPAGDAQNFIAVFENDAQRFSGATNVPLAQLGVLSNTYTSSDALSATNDPLILDVEAMNRRNKASMEKVGRLMLAIARGTTVDQLGDDGDAIIAHFADPSMPTFAARADGWTKIGAADTSIVGGRVWYEGMGMPRETIDRIMAEKDSKQAQAAYDIIFSNARTTQAAQPVQQTPEPDVAQAAEVSGE